MEDLFSTWIVNTYIAHRGLHNEEAPENSLKAFQNAIDKHYAIELDVNLIADNTVVVFHDTKLSRMTGKDKYIQNLTEEDLINTNLLNSNEKIPTLKQVLDLVNGQVPLLIEIKSGTKVGALEKETYELLKDYKGEIAIMSFNPYSLKWFKTHAPQIVRGQLSSYFKGEKLSFFKKSMLKRLHINRISDPNFIAYDCKNLPNRFVKKYEKLPLLAWTVESQEEYLRVVKYCDNIIFQNFIPTI